MNVFSGLIGGVLFIFGLFLSSIVFAILRRCKAIEFAFLIRPAILQILFISIRVALLHLLERALLGLESKADRRKLFCVRLRLTKAFRHIIVLLILRQLLRLGTLLVDLFLVLTHVLDLCDVLLHLDHNSFDALHLLCIED